MRFFYILEVNIFLLSFMIQSISIHRGDQIISLPTANTDDLIFSRAVILLTEHNNDGSVGFILNKPLDLTVGDLVPHIESSFTIYDGGPVQKNRLYYIHSKPELIPDSIHIVDDLYWGVEFEELPRLLSEGLLHKSDIRFFLGYSGWDCDQLKNEIEDNFWVKTNTLGTENIFSQSPKDLWKNSLAKLGNKYSLWLNAPENPNFN